MSHGGEGIIDFSMSAVQAPVVSNLLAKGGIELAAGAFTSASWPRGLNPVAETIRRYVASS